jgi:hypothetical protein
MQRVAALVLVAGGILILSWVVAPAAPASKPATPLTTTLTAYEQTTAPLLAEVTAQVTRMRERLATTPAAPEPGRDPFRFGRRPEPAVRNIAPPPPPVIEPPAAIVVPKLVAVLSTTTDAGVTRRAALAVGDDVKVVEVGATVGTLTVTKIDADTIELTDRATGAVYRIR